MSEEARARHWRKSRRSIANGDCIEVAEDWRTATASAYNGNCVEVASGVHVRDSKQPGGTVLTFAPGAWQAFTADPAAALRGAA